MKQPSPVLEPGRVSPIRVGSGLTQPSLSPPLFFSRLSHLSLSFFSLSLISLSLTWIEPRPPWPRSLLSHRHYAPPAPPLTSAVALPFSLSAALSSLSLSFFPLLNPWPLSLSQAHGSLSLSLSPRLGQGHVMAVGFGGRLWVMEVVGMVGDLAVGLGL